MATSASVPSPHPRHRRTSSERAMDRMDDFVLVLNDILFDRTSEKTPKSESESSKAARQKEQERVKHSFGMVVLLKAIQYMSSQETWNEDARRALVRYYYEAVGKLRMMENVEELMKKAGLRMLDVKVPDVIENVEEFSETAEEIPSHSEVELKARDEK